VSQSAGTVGQFQSESVRTNALIRQTRTAFASDSYPRFSEEVLGECRIGVPGAMTCVRSELGPKDMLGLIQRSESGDSGVLIHLACSGVVLTPS
jgi:hypothetical protein